jgi:hypothetical protein
MAKLYLNEWLQDNEFKKGFVEIDDNAEFILPELTEGDSVLISYFDKDGRQLGVEIIDAMFGRQGVKLGEYKDGDTYDRNTLIVNYITKSKMLPYAGEE